MTRTRILIIACITCFSANAQQDFSSVWTNYAPGSTLYNSNSFDGSFEVTNESGQTFQAGDTLWVGYQLDGNFYSLDLTPGSASFVLLQNDLTPGSSITTGAPGTPTIGGLSSPIQVCCVVFGVGMSSVSPSFPLDDNPNDNTSCFVLNPNNDPSASIEENQLSFMFELYGSTHELIWNWETGATAEVCLINSLGQTVYKTTKSFDPGISKESIQLQPGTYYVIVNIDGHTIRNKIALL
ncbi:MAG: T9SS type A sorting domain-containing protein [bacterium]|nr:T9SS type A sorting domain-containing protein [bacterium]